MSPAQPQTYEIVDGVRRAWAYLDAGHTTIPAQIDGVGPVVDIPIADLLSPHKSQIDTTLPGGVTRLQRVVQVVHGGVALPPIHVQLGRRGIPFAQVQVV